MYRLVLCLMFVGMLSAAVVQAQTDDEALDVAHQLIAHLNAGEYDDAFAMFDATMAGAVPVDKLEELWGTTLPAQVGAYKDELASSVVESGGYKVVVLTLAFEKVALDTTITIDADKHVAGLFFKPNTSVPGAQQAPVPAYVKPDVFTETDIVVGKGTDYELPGTLAMPAGDGPFPAVVLVHGSGPNDRDESVGPNKTFRDIAQGLASKGIAVLRYDKRTKVYGGQVLSEGNLTVQQETIDDALAAVALLRTTDSIDPDHIFVLGHSLGGLLGPRIVAGDDKIAGLIVASGALSSELEATMLRQTQYLVNLDGKVSPEEQKALDDTQAGVTAIQALTADSDPTTMILNAPASYWLDLHAYDPVATALSIKQPILVVQGERDYQVTLDDFNAWKSALTDRPDTTFKTYPALNHLLIAGEGQPNPDEYNTPGNVDETLVNDIAAWILAH